MPSRPPQSSRKLSLTALQEPGWAHGESNALSLSQTASFRRSSSGRRAYLELCWVVSSTLVLVSIQLRIALVTYSLWSSATCFTLRH